MHPEEHLSDSATGEEAPFNEEEFLNRSSTMPPINVQLRGFEEQDANEVGGMIYGYLQTLGKWLNLERLDGVTVAHDYVETLAAIKHGFPNDHVPTPTLDQFGRGIAMTVTVLRDEKPSSHIVIDAGYIKAITKPEELAGKVALHTLVHESVHVHDLLMQDRAYPGRFGKPIPDNREAYLFQMAQPCWEEYIASCLSAGFAPSEETEAYEKAFCQVFEGVRERGKECIRQYISDNDIWKLMSGLRKEYGSMLKYLAYLVGHIAGMDEKFYEAAPKANQAIQDSIFHEHITEFAACLEKMRATYGEWTGIEIFDSLKTNIEELLKTVGVRFSPLPDGQWFLHVNTLRAFL